MPRIDLTAESVAKEMDRLRRNVALSLGVIRKAGNPKPGSTPREVILRRDGITLYRYLHGGSIACAEPLLIVYALVNRPEIADLQRGRSLVQGLLEQGFDVYLLDWGRPGPEDRLRSLDEYINDYLDACVDAVRDRCMRRAVPLLGICQGGTFAICYAALNPSKVERLITTVTPVDFRSDNDMLSHLIRHVDIEQIVDATGNVSGEFLNWLFLSLKPYRLLQQKYLRFLDAIEDPDAVDLFMRMEEWIFDSPSIPAAAAKEFVRNFYQENKLARGELSIGGYRVDPRAIDMPVLNVFARDDDLVPNASSKALRGLVGADDYTEVEIPGGHIGIYVSTKSGDSVPAIVSKWMASRRDVAGQRGAKGRAPR